jgi:hypothetical protein
MGIAANKAAASTGIQSLVRVLGCTDPIRACVVRSLTRF